MNKNDINSVAVMAIKSGKVSLALRYDRPTFPYTWAFAGGSIEKDELWIDAAEREFWEETHLMIPKEKYKFISYAFEGEQKCVVYMVELYPWNRNPYHVEKEKHGPWIWVDIDKVHCLNLMPGVERIINGIYIKEI